MFIEQEKLKVQSPPILDIRYLSEESVQSIRDLIGSNNGSIGVLIHPYYREHLETDMVQSALQHNHSLREGKFVSNYPGVIFVFEAILPDDSCFASTKLRLGFLEHESTVCMVPTKSDSPEPRILNGEKEDSEWNNLITIFRRFGVRSLDMGGRLYYTIPTNKHYGCVYVAKKHLLPNFEVNLIPQLCYPDTPSVY